MSRSPSAKNLNKIGVAILLLGSLIMVAVITSKQMRRADQRGDIEVYVHASRLILDGENIYQVPTPRGKLYYLYPPLFAVVTLPLVPLPPIALMTFWCMLNVFLACWIVVAFYQVIAGASFFALSARDRWILGFVPLVMSGRAIIYNADLAQANLLVAAVAVLGLRLLAKRQQLSAGIAVGLSVILKVFTAPLIILLAIRKDKRFTAGAAAGIAVGLLLPALLIGWTQNLAYLDYWLREIVGNTDVTANNNWNFTFNFSPEAQLFRFFSSLPAYELRGTQYFLTIVELPKTTIQFLGKAFAAFLGLAVAAYAWRFRNASKLVGLWGGAALCFCLMPILSPVTQKHYFAVLLPTHIYVVYIWHHVGLRDRLFRTLVVASFVWMTMTTNLVGPRIGALMTGLGGLIWSTLVLGAAIFRAGYSLDHSRASDVDTPAGCN